MLEKIAERCAVAVADLDDRGGLAEVNGAFGELFGYPREKLLPMPLALLAHPQDAPAVSAWLERLREGGLRRFDRDLRFLRADGRVIWVRLAAAALKDGGFVCMAEDVTVSHGDEQAAALLAFVVRSTSDAVISCGPDGFVTSMNQGAERLYGYSAGELVGRHYTCFLPPEEIQALEALRLGMLRGEQGPPSREVAVRRKDGILVHVLVSASPIFDAGGAIVGFSTIARDITARKRAEEDILRLNGELEARVRERTRELMTANADLESFNLILSHDLRAPLRKVEFYGARLEQDLVALPDPRDKQYVEKVQTACGRMEALIESMLRLSTMARAPLRYATVDVSALARDIVAELREEEPGRKATVVIADGLTARADSRLLWAALENLLRNSWKFTSRTPEARIEVGGRRDDGTRTFFVRDNGAGFDASQTKRLFRPLQRLHTQEEFEGTGLGLTVVARIIERHGGRVWAEGEPGRGATFYFTLPEVEK